MTRRCVACGHTDSDHGHEPMGARTGTDWLCHQDDHSCYAPPAQTPADWLLLQFDTKLVHRHKHAPRGVFTVKDDHLPDECDIYLNGRCRYFDGAATWPDPNSVLYQLVTPLSGGNTFLQVMEQEAA